MAVSRLLYSSDPYPATGQYKQVTPALEDKWLRRMEPLLELDGGDAATFSYSRLPGGSALISQKVGFAARALFLGAGSVDLRGLLPIDLWRSSLWDGWDDASISALPPGERLSRGELVTSLQRIEKSSAGRLERFFADVNALSATAPGRQIVLIAQPIDIWCLIHAACESLPTERAARLTFTWRSGDPRTAYQQIVGAPDRPTPAFTKPEIRYQYRVHDILDGVQESPPAKEPDAWAQRLAYQWLSGSPQSAEVASFWTPAPTPKGRPEQASITREELFKALRSTTDNAADALKKAGDLTLGDLPSEHARYLGERLCANDLGFIEACGVPLAAMKDVSLLEEALRYVDRQARSDPRSVWTADGFDLLKAVLFHRVPLDCVHLRVLAAASRENSDASLDVRACAVRVENVLRTADLAGAHGQGSALATALSLYWSRRTIPAKDALDLVVRLHEERWLELFDEEVIDRLVDAVLQAPEVDENVIPLSLKLRRFKLRPAHEGALSVLGLAAKSRFEPSIGVLTVYVREIARSLRDRANIECSPAVEQWWIDRMLDTLFCSGPNRFWIEAASDVARCSNKGLLQEYVRRVWESPRVKAELEGDPETLGYAIFTWREIRSENHHWGPACKKLLDSAAQLHRDSSKHKRVAAVISRLESERDRHASSSGSAP